MDILRKNNKTIMFSLIGIMVMIVAVVGVSIAFFNYTRTGAVNNIGTGRIYFNSVQGNTLNINNMFPLKSSEAESQIANLSGVTLQIEGDTTYDDGEEFEVILTNLNNTINGKQIPIKYIATYTANTGASIGEESDTYWTSRESKDSNIYTLEETGTVSNGKQVLVGYIKKGNTGINGTLTIKAYIDGDKIAISDTYDGTESDNMGTTNEWVNGRTVLTTTEWNSLNSTGITFQIKTESNEGIWVEEQDNSTPASCFTTQVSRSCTRNPDMDINTCVSKFTEFGFNEGLIEGETLEAFCNGTRTIRGMTFQEVFFGAPQSILDEFASAGIITIGDSYNAMIRGYDASCGSEVIIPSTINIEQVSYTRKPDMDVNTCVSKFTEFGFNEGLQEGETLEAFCNGNGTIRGMTFQEVFAGVPQSILDEFESAGIITKEVTGTVNASVTTIGNSAFSNNQLTNVEIPNSVTTIGNHAFYNNNITTLSIDMANIPANFASNNGITTLTNLTIGEHVETIGERAFSNNQLTNVEIPNSVTTIGNNAFYGNNIAKIIVPDAMYDEQESTSCYLDSHYNISDEGVIIENKSGSKSCTIIFR